MAYSFIDFNNLTPAQQSGTFAPPTLQFVEPDDIYVSITVAATSTTTALTSNQFTVTTSPSLVVQITDPALLPLSALDTVRVGRTTDIDDLARTFADGSVLKASDLNTQNNQFLYSIQEALDTGSTSLPIGADNKYDAGGRGIKNVGLPTNDGDVATLEYVTSAIIYGTGATLPQSWVFQSGAGTNAGTDRTYILQDPTPATAVDNMFLVEVQGVLQRPGAAYDYTVTELNGVYTLRLFGAAQGQSTGFPDGTQVTVRNFGASRNVLIEPFRAGAVADSSLRIERLANQTGDLINARAENNGSVLFRLTPAGAILIGAGAVNSTTTTFINSDQIEVGDVDGGNWQKYGFLAGNTTGKAKVEIQGSNPANNDVALQVVRGFTNGNVTQPFKVSYDGTLTHSSLINASVNTSNLFCAGPLSVQGGHLDINNAYALRIGANEMNITRDTISGVDKILLEPWGFGASTDTDFGIKTPNVPGSITMASNGNALIGFGGNGTGVPHGGPGSLLFTYQGSSRYGPTMQWSQNGISVRGFNIPTAQGGQAGEDGNQPAFISYVEAEAVSTPLASLDDGDLVCKKMVKDAVVRGWWGCMPSNQVISNAPDNDFVKVELNGVFAEVDPEGKFAYQSTGELTFTEGTWLVEWEGYITPFSSQTGQTHTVKVKLEQDNPGNYTAAYVSRTRNPPPVILQAGQDIENYVYFKIMIVAQGNQVGDNVSLYVACDFPSLASSRTITLLNHSCTVQRLT